MSFHYPNYVYFRVLYADPGKVKLYLHKMEREGIERVKVLRVPYIMSFFQITRSKILMDIRIQIPYIFELTAGTLASLIPGPFQAKCESVNSKDHG